MNNGRILVRIGDLAVAAAGEILATVGLGSCVALALFDPVARIGGLAHVMLPDPVSARSPLPVGRFGSLAVAALLDRMRERGADPRRVHARIVGGAAMFEGVLTGPAQGLGQRNVEAVRQALHTAGVPIRGEEVGGSYGRSVFFHTDEGLLHVTSVRNDDVLL